MGMLIVAAVDPCFPRDQHRICMFRGRKHRVMTGRGVGFPFTYCVLDIKETIKCRWKLCVVSISNAFSIQTKSVTELAFAHTLLSLKDGRFNHYVTHLEIIGSCGLIRNDLGSCRLNIRTRTYSTDVRYVMCLTSERPGGRREVNFDSPPAFHSADRVMLAGLPLSKSNLDEAGINCRGRYEHT